MLPLMSASFPVVLVRSQLPLMQDLALMYEWVVMPQAPRVRVLLRLCSLDASHEQGVL